MDDVLLPLSVFAEAADMDAASTRLAELAIYPALHPLLAANPATPAEVLEQFSTASDPAVRRAVAQNPNASLQVLERLAGEFPQEFLSNPLLLILNMTQPGFIKDLPLSAWMSLLRFENLSLAWFQQLRNDLRYARNQKESWALIQLHITQRGELDGAWQAEASAKIKAYREQLAKPLVLNVANEMELFQLFVLLFPQTVPMLKEQWIRVERALPERASAVLALSKVAGGKTLTALANEKSSQVRCQVARHPCTSTKLLGWLAKHGRPEIRRAVASNPRTSQESISTLLSDPIAAVRRTAVSHASLTREDHEIMALDEDSSVRAALAVLPRLDSALLAQLACDHAPVVRAAVARNLKVPLEILVMLVRDTEPTVRAAAASNPRLPDEAQAALLSDPEFFVRASLSSNARLSEQSVAQLAQDPGLTVRKRLAANPRTPVDLLDQLWQTGEMEVWQGLAHHPQCSPELLVQLAQQGDVRVRAAVAAHKHTPLETLHALAQQNNLEIWYGLLANPHTPLALLEQALATPHTELWSRIIDHPVMVRHQRGPMYALLGEHLQRLIATNRLPNWARRVVFQYARALPASVLAPFASSPHWEERYLVACQHRLPEAMLNTLAHDGICYVRAAARVALEQRRKRETRPGSNLNN